MLGLWVYISLFLMDLSLLVWNVQGACRTVRVLQELLVRYKPSIVVITEPRVSGNEANLIISKLHLDPLARFNWGEDYRK